jgi:hypothetical protein
MIHVEALPGTPANTRSVEAILENALAEAIILRDAGIDALAIENMHDTPYLKGAVGPEIVAAMTAVAREVRKTAQLPCGIQILAGANQAALAVALAADLEFIRAEGFTFAHIGDEGLFESCAGELLRYRRKIGADHIAIWTDIKKKHSSHAITADVGIAATARAAEFFRSDGVIVSGWETGHAPRTDEIAEVRKATKLPIVVGSGVTEDNFPEMLEFADAAIVGSALKENGDWRQPVSAERVNRLMDAVRAWRQFRPDGGAAPRG